MLGFLQRNLRINNRETKASAYYSIVRPNLEYCASIWSPHTAQAKHKIEMVQRRARYVCNRYHKTSSVILTGLQWKPLYYRRIDAKLCMLYKIAHVCYSTNPRKVYPFALLHSRKSAVFFADYGNPFLPPNAYCPRARTHTHTHSAKLKQLNSETQ